MLGIEGERKSDSFQERKFLEKRLDFRARVRQYGQGRRIVFWLLHLSYTGVF